MLRGIPAADHRIVRHVVLFSGQVGSLWTGNSCLSIAQSIRSLDRRCKKNNLHSGTRPIETATHLVRGSLGLSQDVEFRRC